MAQNITLLGANYPDVPAVTLPITGGGTATFSDTRSVTYNLTGGATASVNPSEAVTGQGFSVKLTAPTGYVLSGVTVTMGGVDITSQVFTPDEEGGGGVSKQEATGTVTGDGTTTLAIPCSFEPDEVYVYGDLSGDVNLRGIVSVMIIKNDVFYVTNDSSTSAAQEIGYFIKHNITGYNESDTSNPHAAYANNTLTIDMVTNSSSTRFASSISYSYDLVAYGEGGGGGGGSATLISKSITANGTYDAGDDNADGYSDLTVNVPNSYAAGDEGKVVSNGALVAQTSDTVTQNGTVDTTLISSLLVNVAGISPVKTKTGTFTGNGTRQVTISCDFEPDLIYWTSDPGTTASSGTVAGIIAREMMSANRYRNNSTTNSHYAAIDITDMNTGGSSYSFRATYENSTVTLYCFSNNARSLFTNGRTYTYKFVKWTT